LAGQLQRQSSKFKEECDDALGKLLETSKSQLPGAANPGSDQFTFEKIKRKGGRNLKK
jgi:hypothetical protein